MTAPLAEAATGEDPQRLVRLVLFDVNETLSDMAPMRDRFEAAGLPASPGGGPFATGSAVRLQQGRRRIRRPARR